MSKRVTLIDPLAVVDGREVLFLRDVFGGEVPLSCPYPPLELASTAAVLREGGVPVEFIAANVLGIRHDALIERLRPDPPAFILIPSAWGSLLDDFALLGMLRQHLPHTKLILTGPNVTVDPDRVFRESPADYVILGEPEEAILLLAQGKAAAEVPNLAYRDGDEILRTEQRFPPLYEEYPLPARDLLDLSRYTVPFSRRTPATTISTSRGCAHTCTFCPSQIWHKRNVRYRPVALVMEEIEELVHRYGMREICFRDDTFTGNRERVVEICEELLRRGLDLTWRCFGSASTVDADLLALMAAAGCTQICYGFESGDDAVLRKTGKGTTVAQGVDAIRWSKQAGLEVSGTFMVGLEGDTHDTVERSIQFACSNALDYIQVNIAVAMPGTGFGKRRERKGLDSRPEFFRWSGANTSETATLSAEELPKLARKFYRTFYMRPSYIMSRLTSRRGIQSLHSHAKLGLRMVRYLAEPYLSRSA